MNSWTTLVIKSIRLSNDVFIHNLSNDFRKLNQNKLKLKKHFQHNGH